MIGQTLDNPFRHPAPEDLGDERGQPAEGVPRLAGDHRPVNDLEPSRVGGKRPVHPAIDKAPQALHHHAHVTVLAQFDGDLLGANFAQVQASYNLVLWEVENKPAPGAAAHVRATSRCGNHKRTLARNLQVVETLPDLRGSLVASLAFGIPAQLWLVQ